MVEPAVLAMSDLRLTDLALLGGIAFVMSVVAGLSGYGTGLVLPAFIAPVVGVVGVVPVMAVVMSFGTASRVWVYRRAISVRSAAMCLLPALPMALLGALIYAHLPADAIASILGLFLVATVPLRRVLEHRKFSVGRRGLVVVGAGYGFLAGGMTGAGLFMVAGLLAAGMQGSALVATDAVVATAINLLKVGVFGGYALLTPPLALVGVLVGTCTVPGAFVARRIMDRLPLRVHIWMMEVLVVAGGLSFLWRAVR